MRSGTGIGPTSPWGRALKLALARRCDTLPGEIAWPRLVARVSHLLARRLPVGRLPTRPWGLTALAVLGLSTGLAAHLRAGEPAPAQIQPAPASELTNPAPAQPRRSRPADRPDKGSLARPGVDDRWLEQWRRLSPEQRQAKLKELRQKYGFGPAPHESVTKWRQEWEALSPEQRRARLAQWRQQRAEALQFSPSERELQRQQLRERLDQALAALRQKASNNLITVEERNRLDRLEELAQRFKPGVPSAAQPKEAARPAAGPVPASDRPEVRTQKPDAP